MKIVPSSIVFALFALACVPQDRYDKAVKTAENEMAANARCSADAARLRSEVDRLNAALTEALASLEARDKALSGGQVAQHELQTKLDDATAQTEQLVAELQRLGKNAEALLAEKGSLASALTDAKNRLEELRKAQAAADARAALFRDLALKFRKMVDAGQLKITLRDGRMVIQLANDVLFDSGQTNLKPEGQKAIDQLSAVLKTIPNRRFQVAGHTDNVPIGRSSYQSNWDLSAARAVEVVRVIVKDGVQPGLLSAAGYGEFDPVAPNDVPANRAKNRRIEITLQPNIEELVAVPETK